MSTSERERGAGKVGGPIPPLVGGPRRAGSQQIFNDLNKIFSIVFTRENTSTMPQFVDHHDGHIIKMVAFTPAMILDEV